MAGATAPGAAASSEAEAARVLQCVGPVYAAGVLEISEKGGSTPAEALTAFPRGPADPLPLYGYDVLDRSDDMVLFVYRNGRAIRAAVRVERNAKTLDGSPSRDPWTFTSWAGCDPVEFAPSADDEIGINLVRRADGTRLPARLVHQRPANDHCLPGVSSLFVGDRLPAYVRDPQQEVAEELLVPYEGDTALPAAAVDTGLRTGSFALFAGADARAIYAVGAGRVERWPARLPRAATACG